MSNQALLQKYGTIIAEEVNVKEVSLLPDGIQVTKTYVPIGKELSAAFGKDTGQIIAAAKQGNVNEISAGQIEVHQGDSSWTLDAHQYEIRYSGLAGDNQIVEEGAIVELDLTLTDELKAEGVAREISRFLNQMRKDADYNVSDRVYCQFTTNSDSLTEVIKKSEQYLTAEALLIAVKEETKESLEFFKDQSTKGTHHSIFEIEEGTVQFLLSIAPNPGFKE